jgi:hypothetical protein
VHELGINSPGVLQLRKEGDLEADSIGRTRERNRARRGEEEGVLTCGATASATRREGNAARARAAGPATGLAGLGPRQGNGGREDGRTRGRQAGRGRGWLPTELGRKPKERRIPFSFFLFKYFKAFLNYFESSFEFKSNHSIQKFKYNSMSAQTCFYPYI